VIEEIVGRLLEKSPANRYPDADALRGTAGREAGGRWRGRGARDGYSWHEPSEPVMLSSRSAGSVVSCRATAGEHRHDHAARGICPRGDQPLLTQGYDASLVKQSAVEAGIEQ
jgi:hypothetical protein